jgi:integrase/recombinase XerD
MKYMHADLKLKERALDRTAATGQQLGRYRPSDTVLDFLDSLTDPGRE